MSLPTVTTRRRLLTVLPTAVLGSGAGCLGLDRMDDLTVYNTTERSLTTEIAVADTADRVEDTATTDRPVFTAEWTLEAGAERRARDPLPASGQFTVTVSLPDREQVSHEWRRAGPTEGLVIWLGTEQVEFGTLTN